MVTSIVQVPGFGANAKRLFQQGRDKFAGEDYDGAASAFREAIAEDPLMGDAYKALFVILEKKGNYAAIIESINKANKEHGVDLDIDFKVYMYYKLAESYLKTDDMMLAQETLKKAYRLNDADPKYREILAGIEKRKVRIVADAKGKASALVSQGALVEAIKAIEEGLHADQGNRELRTMLQDIKSRIRSEEMEKEAKTYLIKIKTKLRAQAWDEAILAADEALAAQPENRTFQELKVKAVDERNRYQEELEARLRQEEERKNTSAKIEYFLKLGRRHMEDESWKSAIEAFDNVLSIDSSNSSARKGVEEATEAMRLSDSIKEGEKFFAEGRWDDAAKRFQYALQRVPSSKKYTTLLAKTYVETQKYEEAVKVYRNYLSMFPKTYTILISIGDIYLQMNEPARARVEFKAYLDQDPKNLEVSLKLGSCFLKENNYADAVKFFKEANSRLSDKKERLMVMRELAHCYDKMKDPSEALQVYREMVGLDEGVDGQVECFYKMGNIYFERGEYADALERYKNVERLKPHYLDIDERMKECTLKKWMPILKFAGGGVGLVILWYLMSFANPLFEWMQGRKKEGLLKNAKVYRQAGQWDKAVSTCEELLKLPLDIGETKEIRLAMAHSFYKIGKMDRSVAECEKVLDMERNNKTAYKILGTIYLERKDYDKALQQCRYVFDFDINNVAMHEIMQKAYKALNNVEELIMEYEEMVHMNPDNMQLRNILLKLKKEENIS
jgi:tetratricopeptide (TPR) repeat protein